MMKRFRFALLVTVALCVLALPAVGAGDDGADPSALTALSSVPGVLDASATATTSSDADSALVEQTAAVTVDVPTDPSAGVTLDPASGDAVNVGIPNADQAGDAVPVAAGVVVYPDVAPSAAVAVQVIPADEPAAAPPADGTDAVPPSDPPATTADTPNDVPAADPAPAPLADTAAPASSDGGGVRMLTVLQDADAPTSYAFQLAIPDGGSIVPDGSGGYDVVDSGGAVTLAIPAPWARDANDAAVPAAYSLDGSTLTLNIDTSQATFPVTADPSVTVKAPAKLPIPAPAPPKPVIVPKPTPPPPPPPPPPAPKPELQCLAVSTSQVSTKCSVAVSLHAGAYSAAYGSATVWVTCKDCGDTLMSQLSRVAGSMASWKTDIDCDKCQGADDRLGTKDKIKQKLVAGTCNVLGLVEGTCQAILQKQSQAVGQLEEQKTCVSAITARGFLATGRRDSYALAVGFALWCGSQGGDATGHVDADSIRAALFGISA